MLEAPQHLRAAWRTNVHAWSALLAMLQTPSHQHQYLSVDLQVREGSEDAVPPICDPGGTS